MYLREWYVLPAATLGAVGADAASGTGLEPPVCHASVGQRTANIQRGILKGDVVHRCGSDVTVQRARPGGQTGGRRRRINRSASS
jgi:hypothetical protein